MNCSIINTVVYRQTIRLLFDVSLWICDCYIVGTIWCRATIASIWWIHSTDIWYIPVITSVKILNNCFIL